MSRATVPGKLNAVTLASRPLVPFMATAVTLDHTPVSRAKVDSRLTVARQIAAIPGHERVMYQTALRVMVTRRAILKIR